MKDFCTMGCNHCHLSVDSKKEIEQIKKEAVKEFAEKVQKYCWHRECDELLKEY